LESTHKQKGKEDSTVWNVDSGGSKKACITWGCTFAPPHLANMTEPSMCGGDAALPSNYFDHLFVEG